MCVCGWLGVFPAPVPGQLLLAKLSQINAKNASKYFSTCLEIARKEDREKSRTERGDSGQREWKARGKVSR